MYCVALSYLNNTPYPLTRSANAQRPLSILDAGMVWSLGSSLDSEAGDIYGNDLFTRMYSMQ
jgi:hypothetical protein